MDWRGDGLRGGAWEIGHLKTLLRQSFAQGANLPETNCADKAPPRRKIARRAVYALYPAASLRLKDAMSFCARSPILRIIGPVRA
jgi:hypothetical protein